MLSTTQMEQIITAVSVGGARAVAAQYVGVTVQAIVEHAERDDEFRARLARADSNCELMCLKNIRKATDDPKQWRASAWLLERRFPDRYNKRRANTVTPDQIATMLGQFSQILLREILDDAIRLRIFQSIHELQKTLTLEIHPLDSQELDRTAAASAVSKSPASPTATDQLVEVLTDAFPVNQ